MTHHLPRLAVDGATRSESSSGMYAGGSGEGDGDCFQTLTLGLAVPAGDDV
jgi:hypothetical protein